MVKFEVCIDSNFCKGCDMCRVCCPKEIIVLSKHINERGYTAAEVIDQEKCIGCKACALICPDCAITIYKEDAAV